MQSPSACSTGIPVQCGFRGGWDAAMEQSLTGEKTPPSDIAMPIARRPCSEKRHQHECLLTVYVALGFRVVNPADACHRDHLDGAVFKDAPDSPGSERGASGWESFLPLDDVAFHGFDLVDALRWAYVVPLVDR